MNRDILSAMLGEEYEVIEAADGAEAVAVLQKRSHEISLVLLDIVMPVMDGFEVLTIMNKKKWIESIPVIMISAENSPSYVDRAYDLGVTDFISKPFDALIVRRRVVNTIILYAKQNKLVGLVADQIYEKEKNNNMMISILSHIVEFRNGESGLHVLHVQTITEILLRRLVKKTDKYDISDQDITLISTASALHDIGKISIPDEILNKPGRFTPEEFAIMKTHSMAGASMLKDLDIHKDEKLVKIAYEICRWHHERYDGKGYPDGLKGDEIPITAQIVSIADVYDALTSERVYKKAYSHQKAMEMIVGGECGSFNPLLLECLEECVDKIIAELSENSPKSHENIDISRVTSEMLRHKELSVTERTLELLEYERVKNHFFMSLSKDFVFEYIADPSMLIVSPGTAKDLNIKEYTVNPGQDEAVIKALGSDVFGEMAKLMRDTDPDDPVRYSQQTLIVHGVPHKMNLVCRSMWTGGAKPSYYGTIGTGTYCGAKSAEKGVDDLIQSNDALTGLMKLDCAEELISARLENAGGRYIMLIADIDGFGAANEKYGRAFGDNLLLHTAEKTRRCCTRGSVAARAGGDEFLLFMELDEDTDLKETGMKVFSVFDSKDEMFPMSVSIGAAEYSDGDSFDMLFDKAARALAAAKIESGSIRFFDDSVDCKAAAISSIC